MSCFFETFCHEIVQSLNSEGLHLRDIFDLMRLLQNCNRDYSFGVGFSVEDITWTLPVIRNCVKKLECDRLLEILNATIIVSLLIKKTCDVVDLVLNP